MPFKCSLLSVSLEPNAIHTAGSAVAEGNPEELFAQVHVVLRVLVCSLGKKHCCVCARGGQPTSPGDLPPNTEVRTLNLEEVLPDGMCSDTVLWK